jgi:ABC-type Mn2+/Zn2+ transport system ATPase subunit
VSHPAIELLDVSVTRSKRPILHVPHLSVAAGDFLGIVGPNGAGKTTLLRVCTSLLLPDAGQVRILGTDPRQASAWSRSGIRRFIGYVPQSIEHKQDVPFTLGNVVSMGLYGRRGLLKTLKRQDRQKVAFWIDRLGLHPLAKRPYRSLSGGEQRKALIARAMVQDPKLLLLDEPGANLDLDWKEQLTQLIEQLFQSLNLTVLLVSHETWQLPAACNRVALMKEGRIVRIGARQETLSREALSQLYGCPVETVIRGGRFHALSVGQERGKDVPH